MVVGNQKEHNDVVPATLFFCFLGWPVVDSGLDPSSIS